MKVLIIHTWDEGDFICDTIESFHAFMENYRKVNSKRLQEAGYKQLIPGAEEVKMSRKKFNSFPASVESARYFNGLNLTESEAKDERIS